MTKPLLCFLLILSRRPPDHPFTAERHHLIIRRVLYEESFNAWWAGLCYDKWDLPPKIGPRRLTEGRKRNEEAYEKMLEQTGWKNEKGNGIKMILS